MLNRTILIGRLTRDVEIRKTGTGKSVTNFSIAVARGFGKDETDFINCIAWDKTADFMANYLSKGSLISIEGRIQTGSYDKDGKKVYTTDVVADRVQSLESKSQREEQPQEQSYIQEEPVLDITSDDLPFS